MEVAHGVSVWGGVLCLLLRSSSSSSSRQCRQQDQAAAAAEAPAAWQHTSGGKGAPHQYFQGFTLRWLQSLMAVMSCTPFC